MNTGLTIVVLFQLATQSMSHEMSLVESCTQKVKTHIVQAADQMQKLLEKDAISVYINTINKLCDGAEINETVPFFHANSVVLVELTEFMKTLNASEQTEFLGLQRNLDFKGELKFIKQKYDEGQSSEKAKLQKLLKNLVPLLLTNLNVSSVVTDYFNSVNADTLIKIMDLLEDPTKEKALQTFLTTTFNQLRLPESERKEVSEFVKSVHRVYAAKNGATRPNRRSSA